MCGERDEECPLPSWELRELVQVISHGVQDAMEGRARRKSMEGQESRDQRSPGRLQVHAQVGIEHVESEITGNCGQMSVTEVG